MKGNGSGEEREGSGRGGERVGNGWRGGRRGACWLAAGHPRVCTCVRAQLIFKSTPLQGLLALSCAFVCACVRVRACARGCARGCGGKGHPEGDIWVRRVCVRRGKAADE